MKKVFITMIAFLAISSSVMADGHVDSVRYLTTKATPALKCASTADDTVLPPETGEGKSAAWCFGASAMS